MATQTSNLRFFYNGIKTSNGVLQKGSWHIYKDTNKIRFFADGYTSLSQEIQKAFKVENDTDSMTDYFEKDSFFVTPGHKYYNECLQAANARHEKFLARMAKKEEKRKARA